MSSLTLSSLAAIVCLVGGAATTPMAVGQHESGPAAKSQAAAQLGDTLLGYTRRMRRAADRVFTTPRSTMRAPDWEALRILVPQYERIADQFLAQVDAEMRGRQDSHEEAVTAFRQDIERLRIMRREGVPGFLPGHARRLRRLVRELGVMR